MSRFPAVSDLFRSRSQVRRRKPSRRRDADRFTGRMESLESRSMLAFSPLPASGNLGGLPLSVVSDATGPNELSIILDDTTNAGSITATITTNDAVPQTRQYFNFSEISYRASNDTDGAVINSVRLSTSYEADLAGFENAPSDESQVGLATLWQVNSRFPSGTRRLTTQNIDRLSVTSGVIGGGASTIAGEFESPTLAPADATTAAQITLNSGTRVTGANIGGTAALDPIVVYSLAITTQTGDVNLAADVFTVGNLAINAAQDVTLTGLLQVEEGDITITSISGDLELRSSTFFAHALGGSVSLTSECGTVAVQKVCAAANVTVIGELGVTVGSVVDAGGNITITAENGPATVADLLAGGAIDIDAGKAITVNGLVRASAGDIAITSVSDGVGVAAAAKVHAVAGSIDIDATRGPASLQNLFAEETITVDSLGDVALNGTIQTTTGDLVVNSDGNIGNSARLLVGGSLMLDSGLNVSSLGGGIVRLELLSGGRDYEYAIVTIAPPAAGGGRAALARATISGGQVTALTIVDPGYGYAPNEQVAVSIEGNPATPGLLGGTPAASGARATAFAGSTLSSMQAGKNLEIKASTAVDITNELRAEAGAVSVSVSAGPLSLSDIFAGDDVSLTAAQTIDLGGLVRTSAGDVSVESQGGGVDVSATVLAPAGGATVTAAGQVVQRGGSVSRDRLFLLSGGRDYTYALVVVDPPPGAGQAALARAVITYYDPLDPTEGGYISDIVLLDPGWGYPSDSRVNVSIQGDGEGATAVFATDIVTSSIDARDDVIVQAGDAITLVSSVRSSAGSVTLRNSMGDLAVQSVTSALTADVESARGRVTLVSVAAGDSVDIAAFRGVAVTDSVNTTKGDITITTTDGDLQFVQGFDFGDNYLVDADATALQPLAVIATEEGGIELRSDNGSITTPFVINATGDVTISSFGLLEASNEITSTQGNVLLQSTSGLVQLGANVAAIGGSVTIEAHTQLKQQVMSGVSKIQLLSPGEVVVNTAPQVTVTVAAPRNGGTAATAVAIIERRSTGGGGFGVDEEEYFLGAIAVIDAGQGYAVGEQPSVTITGINGASARAYGPLNAAMLAAGGDIELRAGEDLTLVTKVHAATGNVIVESAAGNVDLSDQSLLLGAATGEVSVDARRGSVVLRRSAAAENVTINGFAGISILGSVVSEAADIALTAQDGAVDAHQVNAAGDVTITSFQTGTLSGEIASSAGSVTFTSLAGGLFLEANVVAAGAVDVGAQTFILQDGRSGVERIDVINSGSATGPTAPVVTVTVAAPAAGGVAAKAQAIIGQRSATDYFLESIFITDPGTGYARGELPEVTIAGMTGASARAFGPTNQRNVTGGAGVTLAAGDDITLANAVTATTGDILVASVSGDVDMGVSSALLNAVVGSVTIKSDTGFALVNAAYAGGDITVDAAEQVTLFGVLESDAGDVEVKSWKRDVDLTPSGARIAVDAGSATLTALNGSVLTPRVLHADGDVTIRGLTTVELRNEITSDGGSITVESVSGGIDISGNINAATSAIDLVAHGAVTQSGRGVAYVAVLSGGQGYDDSATVTIAAPARNGGRAASARVVLGTVSGVSGVIIGISVVDPGEGYAVGEVPVVTINPGVSGGTGGAAGAVVADGEQNLVGGTGVGITAGDDITLLNTVTATTGDVVVTSLSGDLALGDDGFLARALGGSVSLAGTAGSLVVQRVSAVEDVTLFGAKGVTVEGSVDAGNDLLVVTGADGRVSATRLVAGDSVTVTAGDDVELLELVDAATGGVAVTSTSGNVVTNDIYAELDITLTGEQQVTLLGVVASKTSQVEVTSFGSIELRGTVIAANESAGSVTLTALGGITQLTGRVTSVAVVAGGSGYDNDTVVTIGAPANGSGTAATARAILGVVNGIAGVITGIEILTPGSGYAAGEQPFVTIEGAGSGAVALATAQSSTAITGGTAVAITAGENVSLLNLVRSTAGDVNVTSTTGALAIGQVIAADEVVLVGEKGVILQNDVDGGGDIEVSAPGGVIDSAVSSKQISSSDGAITISARTAFLGPMRAQESITVGAEGSVVVSAVTSQTGVLNVVSETDSVSIGGITVAESINGSAQREFAILAPVTARTGGVTIEATDGTISLQADVIAAKGDIDLTGRAILQSGIGVAKVVIDPVDPTGKLPGQKAGEGYSATTTKAMISAPRRGGTAAVAVPIIGKVRVGTNEVTTVDGKGNTTTTPVPIFSDSGIVQLILTSPGSGYEIGETPTITFIDPNVESEASATVTLQSVVPIAALVADFGEIRLNATTETLAVQTIKAGSSVALTANKSVTITDSLVSGGEITLTSSAGGVTARDLEASTGITIASFEDVRLSRQIYAQTGDIGIRSSAGSVAMAANVLASEGDVVLKAHHEISQSQNGLEEIVLTFGGSGYTNPIVTVSPPRGGGTAATARAIVATNDGPGPVLAIELLTPGSGYAPGEFVTVTIQQAGAQGAAAIGIASNSDPKIVAGGEIAFDAGGNVTVSNEVRAVTGNVSILSVAGDIEMTGSTATIRAEANAVSVSAVAGLVSLGRVVARENIDISSLQALNSAGAIVSEAGDISLVSKAASVSFGSVVSAEIGSIDISAFATIESNRSGVSRIEILSSGTGFDQDNTGVIFAPPGGTLDQQGNASGARRGSRAATGRVNVDEQGRIVSVEITDPGVGYLAGEAVEVLFVPNNSGARAVAYVDRPEVTLAAGKNVTLTAGGDVEVTATMRSTKLGDVSVSSLSGDVSLDFDGSLLQAIQGGVTITATAGKVQMPEVTAGGSVFALAQTGLTVGRTVDAGTGDIQLRTLHGELRIGSEASVVAKTGSILLAGEKGAVETLGVLRAEDGISVSSSGEVNAAGSIVSNGGAIDLTSAASDINLSGIVSANGNRLLVSAFGNIESSTGGVTRIEVVKRGANYDDVFTDVVIVRNNETVDADGRIVPDPAQTIPREGFRPAVARAVVSPDGEIAGIEIVDPGQRYLATDILRVVIRDRRGSGGTFGDGASAVAFAGRSDQTLSGLLDVEVSAGRDVQLGGVVRSLQGDIMVYSTSGNLGSAGQELPLLQAIRGGVSVGAAAGGAWVSQIAAADRVDIQAKLDVTVSKNIDSTAGDIAITTTQGNITLTEATLVAEAGAISLTSVAGEISSPSVLAADDAIRVSSLGRLNLAGSIVSAAGQISLQSTAGNVGFNGIITAERGEASIAAFGAIESFAGGISRVNLIGEGDNYLQAFTRVFVLTNGETLDNDLNVLPDPTAANTRDGFRRATVLASIAEDGTIASLRIGDPGKGYLESDVVRIEVRDTRTGEVAEGEVRGSGASGVAYVDAAVQTLSAFGDASLLAGEAIGLVGKVRSYEGDVRVASASGDLDLGGEDVLLQAHKGSVSVVADAGIAQLQQITAGNDVVVQAKTGVELSGNIDSTLGTIFLTTTHGDLDLGRPGASLVAEGGGVVLSSKAGRITTPDAITASGQIAIEGFGSVVLNGRIEASSGAVDIKSIAGDIDLNAIVEAQDNTLSLQAFANINSRDGGVSRFDVVTTGAGYAENNTLVYVLFNDDTVDEETFTLTDGNTARSRPDFRRAAARAILNEQGGVVGVELVDRGSGYLPTDRLITRVFDTRPTEPVNRRVGDGATLVTYVDPSAQTVSAGDDVTVKAGDNIELIGIVRSTSGDVRVESATGDIDLDANESVLQAISGEITVSALVGKASIRQIVAKSDVGLAASRGVTIVRAIESQSGDISVRSDVGDIDLDAVSDDGGVRVLASVGSVNITSTTGKINTPQSLRAGRDITIVSLGNVELSNSIVSDAGDISVETEAARVTLNAVVKAGGGSVAIKSNSDLDDIGGGLTRITMVSFGGDYSNRTRVEVARPRNGGDPARVRPIIENGRILSLEIIYPGKGYEPGETVVLISDTAFVDEGDNFGNRGRGAEAIAFCDSPTQSIEAKESIAIDTRDDLRMFGVLRAEGVGGITLRSRAGNIDLVGANRTSTVVDATNGSVAVFAPTGAARVSELLADANVVVRAEQDITAAGLIRATEGAISVVSTSGNVVVQGEGKLHAVVGNVEVLATRGSATVQNLLAGQDITLATLSDVKLTEAVHAAAGDLTVVTKASIDNAGSVETGGSISLSATLGVTSLGGGIVKIDLLSGGTDYEYAIVTISGPASGGGRAATARATINEQKEITDIVIVDPGYGYASGEVVRVDIQGQPERLNRDGVLIPAGEGARAVATAGRISSSLTAGDSIAITAGTVVDLTNELQAKTGGVTIAVAAGPLKASEVYAAQDVVLTAAQTIGLGGLLRTSSGDVAIQSTGGGFDMRGIIRAPGGKVQIDTAGEVVQRGGSISRDKIYLLSGGSGYTSALVVVDPPPGGGQAALAQAIITDPDPFDNDETGYVSEIILLDSGWGYPSDSRINVRIIGGGGRGAAAVFGTDVISSTIEANGDVSITSGDDITLVSTVRSATGDVGILATLGDVSIESITAGQTVDIASERGKVTLVSVAAAQAATIAADQGVLVTDSLNTISGDITIEATNGDITFVKESPFVGDYIIVDDTAVAVEPRAVISSKAGGVAVFAYNGAIVTPYVINAGGDVTLTSLRGMELTNQITSQGGDIQVESTSGLVRVRSNMVAESGSITVEAQTTLQQEFVSGVSKIELLSSGPASTVPPAVSVTVAAPRNGGEAATALAIIAKRPLDNVTDDGDDDPFDNIIEYEYYIGAIAVIDPGYGYELDENPIVTITGVDGATARAFGPTSVAMITAQEDVSLLAGENVTLITKIHAVEGTVTVASKAGDIDLTANSLFLSSKAGGIDIDAFGGSVSLQRAAGFTDVTVNAMEEVNVLRSVMSQNGGIVITSTSNAVDVRQLNAMGDISVSGFKTSKLVGEIASANGDVIATSGAGGLRINANIFAGQDVLLTAQRSIQQLDPTGIEALEVISAGTDTQNTLTPVPPTVTVTIAPPAAGGRAATAGAIVGKRFIGNDPGGTEPIWEYYIQRVEIIDAGSGYAIGESPAVTITGMPGAVVTAFTRTSVSAVVADGNLSVVAGGDVELLSAVRSITGDVSIASSGGNLDLSAETFLANAAAGEVSLTTAAGRVDVQRVMADDTVTISGAAGVAIEGVVDSATGSVTVDSTSGEVAIHTILAGDSVTVGASDDVVLQGTIAADDGDISIESRNRDLDFTAADAQLHAVRGDITLTSANGTIMSPPTLNAGGGVSLWSLNTLVLNNEIASSAGDIALNSTAGSVNLGSNINSQDGSVVISAKGAVSQIGGGIGFVRVMNGGSGYTVAATVTIAAPSSGVGQAARAVPIIGRVNGVNGVITGIRLVSPGSGYGAGEQPLVTFTRNATPPAGAIDAEAMAVAAPATGNSGLAVIDVIDAGSGYNASTTVTIAAPAGGGAAATAQAVIGTIVAEDGTVTSGAIIGIVIVSPGSGYGAGEQPTVTIDGAGSGALARAVANITLQDIRAGQDLTVNAGTGLTLLNTIRAENGAVSLASATGTVNLAARTLLVSSFADSVTINAARGAVNVQQVAAAGDIDIDAFTGVTLLNAINSTGDFGTGDVAIKTINGNIAAVAPNGLISVQNGGVSLESVNGTVYVPQVFNVSGDITLKTYGSQSIETPLTSRFGSVTLASAAGSVNLAANLYAEERVTLQAKTGINQTKGFMVGNELVARNETTGVINLATAGNDFKNVALRNIGPVTYVDANDFETGVERIPYSGTPVGVEVAGDAVNLSSTATNSRIRVVSGLNYRTLSIAAGTQGGNNVGYVEYVTTSSADNAQTNAPFMGTLRDMIRYVNDNTATYLNAGNTRVPQAQAMVFDETGYVVEEVSPAAALPAFSRPVWFDGGRLEETASAPRLGIAGSPTLTHGLSFAAATPAVAGVRAATSGSSGSRIEKLAVHGFTKGSGIVLASGTNTVVDLHAGLRADGTVSGNMIGLDVRGAAAINNRIGEQVVDSETVNRFAANSMAGIMIRSGAAGTQVFGSVIGDESGADPTLANGDGIRIVSATRSQIGSVDAVRDDLFDASRSNIIAGNRLAGVQITSAVAGSLAAANVIRNNVIRSNGTGVNVSASAFAVLGGTDARAANVITGQTLSGVVVTDSKSVQIQGNRIGVTPAYGDDAEAVAGNGADGISISGKSQGVEIGSGNWIGGNAAHGVRIGTGVTGVVLTDNTIGGELADGTGAGNGEDGVAITAAIGNTVGMGNVIARNGRHGVSVTDARAETLPAGNRVFGSTISGNRSNGVLVSGGSRTTIGGPAVTDANRITANEENGIRLVSTSVSNAAVGHVIQRNYVGANPAGDVDSTLGNKASGIVLDETREVVVGEGNVVMNNGVDGITVNGGQGVMIGSLNAATGNQIRRNSGNGISFNGIVMGGTVSGNLVGFQGGDGVFVGSGARDVRIGHIVSRSSVSGAANTLRGNAGWGVRVMPGAQRIAVQGNSSFANAQGAMMRGGANTAAPSSMTLTSAVIRVATGGTRQLAVAGTIAGARAKQQYSVDVYASPAGSPNGVNAPQGRRHLGRFNVTATANGTLKFSGTLTATVAVDEWITASATTLVFEPGSTSHFTAPVKATLR